MKALYRLYDAYPLLLRWKRRGASFTGALDGYTADLSAAWSVARRLLSSYSGPLVRVRRSGDNSEFDFSALDDGTLDSAAVIAFCVAGGGTQHGFVTTLYDQSGLGKDFVQTSAASQFRIVNAGAVETLNSNPCMALTSNNQHMITGTWTAYTGTSLSAFCRGKLGQTSSFDRWFSTTKNASDDFDAVTRAVVWSQGGVTSEYYGGGTARGTTNWAKSFGASGFAVSSIFDNTNLVLKDSSGSQSTANTGAFDINRYLLGAYNSTTGNSFSGWKFIELFVYHSDQTANESALRTILLA